MGGCSTKKEALEKETSHTDHQHLKKKKSQFHNPRSCFATLYAVAFTEIVIKQMDEHRSTVSSCICLQSILKH